MPKNPNPKPSNTKVGGISYIGALSVPFRPDTIYTYNTSRVRCFQNIDNSGIDYLNQTGGAVVQHIY